MIHLAVIVAACFAWQCFDDGPLAHYIAQGLLVAYLCAHIAWKSPLWPAFGYGSVMGLMTAGCGALYADKANGYAFLCDAGSSAPISLISGVVAIMACYLLLKRKK